MTDDFPHPVVVAFRRVMLAVAVTFAVAGTLAMIFRWT